jgi:hypothetical protein
MHRFQRAEAFLIDRNRFEKSLSICPAMPFNRDQLLTLVREALVQQ